MNTIPSIFNEKITPYTIVGCKRRLASTGISAIILNTPGYPRKQFFSEIENTGFDNVISIETPSPHYDITQMAESFPFIKFMLPAKGISLGEQINLAVSETESPLFFVLRSDLKIIAGGTANRMAERLILWDNDKINLERTAVGFIRLCTIPVIFNSFYEAFPTLSMPVHRKRKMQTAFIKPAADGQLSLYPFNGIGIYDKQRFINMGGFDITIQNSYWQLLDFGFRSYLWGEEIALSNNLKMLCEDNLQIEKNTIEKNYRRFYLKNLAPVFHRNYAHLPLYRFPGYFYKSGEDLISACEEFNEGRKWIKKNKFRWRCDAHTVAKLWDMPNADSEYDNSYDAPIPEQAVN